MNLAKARSCYCVDALSIQSFLADRPNLSRIPSDPGLRAPINHDRMTSRDTDHDHPIHLGSTNLDRPISIDPSQISRSHHSVSDTRRSVSHSLSRSRSLSWSVSLSPPRELPPTLEVCELSARPLLSDFVQLPHFVGFFCFSFYFYFFYFAKILFWSWSLSHIPRSASPGH